MIEYDNSESPIRLILRWTGSPYSGVVVVGCLGSVGGYVHGHLCTLMIMKKDDYCCWFCVYS